MNPLERREVMGPKAKQDPESVAKPVLKLGLLHPALDDRTAAPFRIEPAAVILHRDQGGIDRLCLADFLLDK